MQPLVIRVAGIRTLLLVLFLVHPARPVLRHPQAPLSAGFHLLKVLLPVLMSVMFINHQLVTPTPLVRVLVLVRFINQSVVPSAQPLVRLLLIRQP